MRRIVSLALTVALVVFLSPAPLGAQGQTGVVMGTATDAAKTPLANHAVRLRSISGPQQGQILGTAQSAANGTFSITAIPGSYVVEVVNAAGQVVGATTSITVAAGATVTVSVAASALAAGAAAAAAAGGLVGLFTGTSLLVITGVGLAGAVLAVQATSTQQTASGSR